MSQAKPDELVEEIEQIRERLAGTVDQLIDRTNPKTIARRSLESVKARFVEEDGSPKMHVILPVIGGTVAVIAGIIVVRRLVR